MTTYHGKCHCGAVKFEVRKQEAPENLMRCNCSLCEKRGAIMAAAKLDDFAVTEGKAFLTLYQWNTNIAKHYFCSRCGIYTHHQRRRRPDEYGYNVACIEELDIDSLGDIPMTDGRDMSLVGESQ